MSKTIKILSFILVMFAPVFSYSQPLTPEPFAELGGKNSGNINSSLLRAQIGVLAHVKGADSYKIKVTSFTLIVNRDEHTSFIKDNIGNRFSDECEAIMKQIQSGDKVIINNIKAQGPDGVIRSLKPIELSVLR